MTHRILLVLTALLLSLFLFACSTVGDLPENEKEQSGSDENSDPSKSSDLISSTEAEDTAFLSFSPDFLEPERAGRQTADGDYIADCIFFSAQEFHQAMKDSWQLPDAIYASGEELTALLNNSNDSEAIQRALSFSAHNIVQMQYYYFPDFSIEGYSLFRINMSSAVIAYQYAPNGYEKTWFDREECIMIYVPRTEYTAAPDPMTDHEVRYMTTRTEDGYVYIEEENKLYFPINGNTGSILVPSSLNNYETLKSICNFRKVTVKADQDEHNEETEGASDQSVIEMHVPVEACISSGPLDTIEELEAYLLGQKGNFDAFAQAGVNSVNGSYSYYYYVPELDVDGYYLHSMEVTPYGYHYYYIPEDYTTSIGGGVIHYSYDSLIEVVVPSYTKSDDVYEFLSTVWKVAPMPHGDFYEKCNVWLCTPLNDQEFAYADFPESMDDYEFMHNAISYRKVTVKADHVTE